MYENITLKRPNFCLGPQQGTFCTIDNTNPTTVLRVKSTSGTQLLELSLSSNIINNNVKIEYVGPNNLTSMVDDLTFYTFERVNSSTCLIKRWKTRMSYLELSLQEQIVKTTSGNERYNTVGFAVERHNRTFVMPNERYNYIDINDNSNIKSGTRLFLGPSSDTTNLGATESVNVTHVASYYWGKRVFLSGPLKYEYAIGDPIIFCSHIFVLSSEGYGGDTRKGSIYKIDAYTWTTSEIDSKSIYKRVTAVKWCPMVGAIACVVNTNMLFVRPKDSYLNWRSMYLGNIGIDLSTIIMIHDIVFDGYELYKLQTAMVSVDDYGDRTEHIWSTFNYQRDSLLPYSRSVNVFQQQSIVTGHYKNVDIEIQVRDQFNVGLRDVYLNCYKEGDASSLFDPLSGMLISDFNGKAIINYRSGSVYSGHTEIKARATGSSSSTGSVYCWGFNNIISYPNTPNKEKIIKQVLNVTGRNYNTTQKTSNFMVGKCENPSNYDDGYTSCSNFKWIFPGVNIISKSYYTSPGGNWIVKDPPDQSSYKLIEEYLPMLFRGPLNQLDGPELYNNLGFETKWPPEDRSLFDTTVFYISNTLTTVRDFEAYSFMKTLTDFTLYRCKGTNVEVADDPYFPYVKIKQPEEKGHFVLSQLNLSLHTHWVDGEPYDYLWSYDKIDQFIFVEDAVPKFWSEKNPFDTHIWIRLRPFAFSLDNSTFRMWVRELSVVGDTGYYEVTSQVNIINFDAGGGMLGIEAFFNPPKDFMFGSTVFVRIEIYDTAYIPNFIYVEYWFKVIPDFKAPYLFNLSPDRGDINVPVDTSISFEIKDAGTGIDVDTLECLLNSVMMDKDFLEIEKFSRSHIKVTYTPPTDLYFSKSYKVGVMVYDISENRNLMNDSFIFYTSDSSGVIITDPVPGICKGGMSRFQDVSVLVLSDGNGVDKESIRMQVFNKDVHSNIVPILYRIS